jgi:hypothetical protein
MGKEEPSSQLWEPTIDLAAARHPLFDVLPRDLQASVQKSDCRHAPGQLPCSKTVSWAVESSGPAAPRTQLDCSSGGASAGSTSSASSAKESGVWVWFGGMQVGASSSGGAACPGCGTHTVGNSDGNSHQCDNTGWNWNGEPPFCCLCASFRVRACSSLAHCQRKLCKPLLVMTGP